MPFSVVNRPIIDPSGHAAVTAERTFRLNGGERTMVDAITAHPTGLIDFLGAAGRYAASFEAVVSRGGLEFRSTRLAVRFGRWHVSVTLDAPLIGKLYEYSGSFTYEIRAGEAGS